jgi:hypothetical protein
MVPSMTLGIAPSAEVLQSERSSDLVHLQEGLLNMCKRPLLSATTKLTDNKERTVNGSNTKKFRKNIKECMKPLCSVKNSGRK